LINFTGFPILEKNIKTGFFLTNDAPPSVNLRTVKDKGWVIDVRLQATVGKPMATEGIKTYDRFREKIKRKIQNSECRMQKPLNLLRLA